jgi:hypothetical protein
VVQNCPNWLFQNPSKRLDVKRLIPLAILLFLLSSIAITGCKTQDARQRAFDDYSVDIDPNETPPEGFVRDTGKDPDLNIGIDVPKGTPKQTPGMQIQNRIGSVADDPEEPTEPDMLRGDVNTDYIVNIVDVLAIIGHFQETCPDPPEDCPTDLDESNRTGIEDLMIVIGNWNATMEPPIGDDEGNTDDPGPMGTIVLGPDPVALDSIYYDFYSRQAERVRLAIELDQGWRTRNWNSKNGVDVLPYVYGGGVDWNADREYTASDLEQFENWLDDNIPYDYNGPICLDMEGEWWTMMNWVGSQDEMDVIIDFYIQGLEYARELRPNARFGYWGLPKKAQTHHTYNGPSIRRLLVESDVIFPDTYENNPGAGDEERIQAHIEKCIEMVEGRVPVHVQMSPRFQDPDIGGYRHFHTMEELIRDQARPALEARWQNEDGYHRVASIGLWDAYVYVRNYHDNWWNLSEADIEDLWTEVDLMHMKIYQELVPLAAEYARTNTDDGDKQDPGSDQQDDGLDHLSDAVR